MVNDRALNVSLGCVTAWALWTVTVALLVVSWFTVDPRYGHTGLTLSAAAATATIRAYFVRQQRLLRTVFELARDDASSGLHAVPPPRVRV